MKESTENRVFNNSVTFNYQMCILKAIAICFVVFGHIRADRLAIGTLYGVFPYYSFHMPIFLFVTGYFYNKVEDSNLLGLLIKKTKNYIVSFYLINGIFLIIQTMMRQIGFAIGDTFSLFTWIVNPWITLEPNTFAKPTWYLIAVFIAEIFYILIRNLIALIFRKERIREVCIGIICVVIGSTAIYTCHYISLSDPLKVLLRSLIMIPFLEAGYLYRYWLEKKDNIANMIYFSTVFLIQYLLIIVTKNGDFHFMLHNLSGYEKVGVEYYIAGLNGIALWLRISRLISQLPKSKLIDSIGTKTKYIMAFHLFGFFFLNSIFALLKTNGLLPTFFERFSMEEFRRNVYYTYKSESRLIPLYFVFGVVISLLIGDICDALGKKHNMNNHHR